VYYFYTYVSADYVACKWRYPPFVTLILNLKNKLLLFAHYSIGTNVGDPE